MRLSARIVLVVLMGAAIVFVSAPAALAKLRLRVVGLEPGHRFGGDQVFNGFGCTGQNRSPELQIAGVPPDTKTLAITMHDPDAATQSGWWHWLAYDLPATTHGLPEGASTSQGDLPSDAQQGPNDFGERAYGGVCPPAGDRPHRYRVTLWALKVSHLGAPTGASAALIDYLIETNAIGHSTVVVRYAR